MKPTDKHEFEVLVAPVVHNNFTFLGRARRSLKALMMSFRLRYDLNRLNARLRRDAGVDEHELERTNIERAPLIH
jgi:uncharacterized protein YjiS (DUF1127 family)